MGSVSEHSLKELVKYKRHDHLHHALLLAFKALKYQGTGSLYELIGTGFVYTVEESLLLLSLAFLI